MTNALIYTQYTHDKSPKLVICKLLKQHDLVNIGYWLPFVYDLTLCEYIYAILKAKNMEKEMKVVQDHIKGLEQSADAAYEYQKRFIKCQLELIE